ncbi:hypothetical protein ACFE04_005374 [Oxalis oulophora]
MQFGNDQRPRARVSPPISRSPEITHRMPSPPPYNAATVTFGTPGSTVRPHQLSGVQRPVKSPPMWDDAQQPFYRDTDAQTHPDPSVSAPRKPGNGFRTKNARFQDTQRNRMANSSPTNENVWRNPNQHVFPRHEAPPRTRSPPLGTNHAVGDFSAPFVEAQPSIFSSPSRGNPRVPVDYSDLQPQQHPSVSQNLFPNSSGTNLRNNGADVRGPYRSRSPPVRFNGALSQENQQLAQNDFKRSSASPTKFGTVSNSFFSSGDSQISQRSSPSRNINMDASRSTSSAVPKRIRSPPPVYANEVSIQDDSEREMQAKAKRLARFKNELSETAQRPDTVDKKYSINRHEQALGQKQKSTGDLPMQETGDSMNGNTLSEYEGLESSSIIVGVCPDMCPESERAERERKGDLDQYERVDGDRNQTSKFLAVKKYTRTAEREACLIRPMPILQRTIDYLLSLLDQPYDDRFLGMYNFLWDRMRAVRMDLRMQHIFNQDSIIMLEQMIRLHIVAMHELCEYTKGEGFSEGFDAHLNIEQMNKTSVELFQMYDDHRKKGINVPSEKEFRGYYALLKLDKHPGYKVEPAELSLDLAKMTPEIRQTPEVLFARAVARACRTGNFIAFFRLAGKATYLQACLMHAHFAKLRTLALASLHSGLQNNQGIPVSQVAQWIGMEEEDIESLLEYHGFSIKEFEEPYMVKEGSFLNIDKDYPTKCSKLVHMKKSRNIVKDVSDSVKEVSLPVINTATKPRRTPIYKTETPSVPLIKRASPVHVVDEEMSDLSRVSSPKGNTETQAIFKTPVITQQANTISPFIFSSSQSSSIPWSPVVKMSEKPKDDIHLKTPPQTKKFNVGDSPLQMFQWHKPNTDIHLTTFPEKKHTGMEDSPFQMLENPNDLENKHFDMDSRPLQIVQSPEMPIQPPQPKYDCAVDNSVTQNVVTVDMENLEPPDFHTEKDNEDDMANYDEEVAMAKLKLILRLWRRRFLRQKDLRQQRQLAAQAALSSLSLGPHIRQNREQKNTLFKFDIDHIMRERYDKHKRSWSRLNVSDVVADTLCRRNPRAKCLCWKIILRSPVDNSQVQSQVIQSAAGQWLLSKLMPSNKDSENDLILSSPGLSIWKKWVPHQAGTDLACCLSIVKHLERPDDLNETAAGASAVLFLVSENIPWNLQKSDLRNLLSSIPSGSCLPLLIMSSSYHKDIIINELGLNEIDKSRISNFSVMFLIDVDKHEQSDDFFSDEQLKEGLKWLAGESQLQPEVSYVKTQELVLTKLSTSLEILDKMSEHDVFPNNCISAFNEALNQSANVIAAAAKENPNNWPCPEIGLLKDCIDEALMVNRYLPSLSWSCDIKPVESAIRACKLPSFPGDVSWLRCGFKKRNEIESHRFLLESSLIKYLTQTSKLVGVALAKKEVSVMLQRDTQLKLHNLSYYIVPNWVVIFRRIFNWSLMSLSAGIYSSAYILKPDQFAPSSEILDQSWSDNIGSSCFSSSHPSLDEIIEVGCSPHSSVSGQLWAKTPPQPSTNNGGALVAFHNNSVEEERNEVQNGQPGVTSDTPITDRLYKANEDTVMASKVTNGGEDKLSKLLEQSDSNPSSPDEPFISSCGSSHESQL